MSPFLTGCFNDTSANLGHLFIWEELPNLLDTEGEERKKDMLTSTKGRGQNQPMGQIMIASWVIHTERNKSFRVPKDP